MHKIIPTILLFCLFSLSTSCSTVKSKPDLLSVSMDLYSRQLFKTAKTSFLKYQAKNSASAFVAFSELKIADCEFYIGQYETAISAYQNFLEQRPKNEAGDYAQLQIAKSYEAIYKSKNTDQSPLEKAIESYKKIASNYPDSLYLKHSLERISSIRDKLATHEIEVAKYYLKTENFAAAKKRLEEVVNNYAETKTAFSVVPILAKENGIKLNRETIIPNKELDLIKSRSLINSNKTFKSVLKN